MDIFYRIWSFEHEAWWKPNWRGYTQLIKEAGIYSFEEAQKICLGANLHHDKFPNEAIVPFNKNGH